jgi:hypothetical protein
MSKNNGGSSQISIKRFNTSTIKPGAIILIIGKRRTGKSTLGRDLLFNLRNQFDVALAMAGTIDTAAELRKIFPTSLVSDNGFDQQRLKTLLKLTTEMTKNGVHKNILLFADDCSSDSGLYKGEAMRYLHMNGRHQNITFINSMQWLLDAKPAIRNQIDYLFVFKEASHMNREKIWKHYFGMFQTRSDFEEVFNKCTNNFECLVLDNTGTSTEIQDTVFWYKAQQVPISFPICKKIYYKLDKYYQKTDKTDMDSEFANLCENKKKNDNGVKLICKEA